MDKKNFIKNISTAFIANLLSLFASLLIVFILPKFLGVLQYSYYQLYIFYASYIGFLGIGWLDGIQLRYGGEYYDKLDKSLFRTEFLLFTLLQLIFSVSIIVAAIFFSPSLPKEFVYIAVAFCILIYIPRALLHNILQATAKIKEYAVTIIIERLVHVSITVVGIVIGQGNFVWFVVSELIGRFVATIYIFYICRDILLADNSSYMEAIKDIKLNISCGLFLMISNIASLLIIGVIRQFIEIFWNIETFGKISLTLAISNFVLVFINSVALVFFPFLKRCPENNLTHIYKKTGTIISVIMPLFFILYFPLKSFFIIWLPQYASTLKYMAILFPICLFESKMCLLINTYMKALRLEKILLILNLTCVAISCILAFVSCKIIHSLSLTVCMITLILTLRCILGELILKKHMDVDFSKNTISEVALTLGFVLLSWNFSLKISAFAYIVIYIIYLYLRKTDVKTFLLGK